MDECACALAQLWLVDQGQGTLDMGCQTVGLCLPRVSRAGVGSFVAWRPVSGCELLRRRRVHKAVVLCRCRIWVLLSFAEFLRLDLGKNIFCGFIKGPSLDVEHDKHA
jgi:hypothetical protein